MITPTVVLHHCLPIAQFERLYRLLQQFSQTIALPQLVLSEAEFAAPVDRFVVIVSPAFSALLTGVLTDRTDYQVNLQFEPDAIAAFLDGLSPGNWSQARSWLQGNEAAVQDAVQSEFARQLLDLLSAPVALPLGDRIMQQIREHVDLPTIMQSSIESIRAALPVDRVVIYQLDSAQSELLPGGMVVYEACAQSVPSVLHLLEVGDLLEQPQQVDRYLKGDVLVVTDVEAQYATAPCLLEFLRAAAVRAKLAAPIAVRHQLWGFVIAHDCQQPRSWSAADRFLLQQSGEYLAVAIAQAVVPVPMPDLPPPDLQEALIAAQAANRAKNEFLSTISHELRTPLTTVIGLSSTLLRWSIGELNLRQRQYLQTIHDSGDRLLHLINDILDLSQLEAGKTVLTLSEFSLTHLAQQSLRSVQEQAIGAQVSLKLDLRFDSQWDSFRGDLHRVKQMLLNLIGNAIKFTPAGGCVTLCVFADDSAVRLQVQDTGIGMSEAQQSLLFRKFQQLDASYGREYSGAGVGLALTKQLVELHGGSIAVESTVGVGSVFTVQLPRPHSIERKPDLSPDRAGRIVLIESDEETAEIICDLLTAAEYQVIWLLDANSAIAQIEILQPIVVIESVTTSDRVAAIDRDLITTLKQNPLTKKIKAIALTSEELPSRAIGADLVLSKPIDPDQLFQSMIDLTVRANSAT